MGLEAGRPASAASRGPGGMSESLAAAVVAEAGCGVVPSEDRARVSSACMVSSRTESALVKLLSGGAAKAGSVAEKRRGPGGRASCGRATFGARGRADLGLLYRIRSFGSPSTERVSRLRRRVEVEVRVRAPADGGCAPGGRPCR